MVTKPKEILNLNNFKIHTHISDDNFNNFKNGEITKYLLPNSLDHITFDTNDFYRTNKAIGMINYRIHSGQVGIFYLEPEFRNKGLGKQIILKVMKEMKDNETKKMFAVTTRDNVFWSNVFNKSFAYVDRVDENVTGMGYIMELNPGYVNHLINSNKQNPYNNKSQ